MYNNHKKTQGMFRNIYIFLTILIITACEKPKSPEEIASEPIKQFIKFELNGKTELYEENDSILIYPFTQSVLYSPNVLGFKYKANLQNKHSVPTSSGTMFEHLTIELYALRLSSEINSGSTCKTLAGENTFLTYFTNKKNRYFINKNNCISNYQNYQVGFSKFYNANSWYSYDIDDNDCFTVNDEFSQTNSKFEITKAIKYQHPLYGKCIAVDGTFEVSLYRFISSSEKNTLVLKNGSFKLLFSECPDLSKVND